MQLDPTDVRVRLREQRERSGLSFQDLADFGCPRASVVQLESGRNRLLLDLVVRMAHAYGTTLEHLLYGDADMATAPPGYWPDDFDEFVDGYLDQVRARLDAAVRASARTKTYLSSEAGFGNHRMSLYFVVRGDRPLRVPPLVALATLEDLDPMDLLRIS